PHSWRCVGRMALCARGVPKRSTVIVSRSASFSARRAACRRRPEPARFFHKSRTPLVKWFLAMHLMTSAKNDIAALELARQLDVKWDTACHHAEADGGDEAAQFDLQACRGRAGRRCLPRR